MNNLFFTCILLGISGFQFSVDRVSSMASKENTANKETPVVGESNWARMEAAIAMEDKKSPASTEDKVNMMNCNFVCNLDGKMDGNRDGKLKDMPEHIEDGKESMRDTAENNKRIC